MKNTVHVIERLSQKVLFETSIEKIDLAYKNAAIFEQMDIEVKILPPSLPETLLKSLGKDDEELVKLKEEICCETNDHL